MRPTRSTIFCSNAVLNFAGTNTRVPLVHTWPELFAVTLDLYVCNFSQDNSAAAREACNRLIAAFAPQRVEQREVMRGGVAGAV